MVTCGHGGKRWRAVLLLALAAVPVAATGVPQIELRIDRMELPAAALEDVQATVRLDDASRGEVEVRIGRLDGGETGYRFRQLRWRCPLRRDAATGRAACEGELHAGGGARATLAATHAGGVLELALTQGDARLSAALGGGAGARVLARRLPATWLQPLLAARWPEGTLTGGRLEADLAQARAPSPGSVLQGTLGVEALGFDSADGLTAAAGLAAQARLRLELAEAGPRLALDGSVTGGEVLAGALYVDLPETPVTFAFEGRRRGGLWQVSRLDWRDPGVLEVDAQATLAPGTPGPLRALRAELAMPDLQQALPRYLESLLGSRGLAKASLSGGLRAILERDDAQWRRVDVALEQAALRDGAGRFALERLQGGVHWTAGDAAAHSQLAWQAAELHGLHFGASTLALESRGGGLALRAPATVPLLGGRLDVSRLAWRPVSGTDGAALDLSVALDAVDLARLSSTFGWPAFPGTLAGRIPAARYAGEVLTLEGGLQADLFGGRVEVSSLVLERPFGVAPSLSAEIALQRLDLQPLTAAFGFGEITGRLDGRIAGLRLLDWSPVAFDADLHSTPGARGARRISRRAVDDLSRVGGGGLAAGLQAQVLKLFDTFGYARLGLRCRLADDVCHMDGLDSSGRGYVIVEGSGLPRITVIGHQRQVDWAVLVARLKAATEGQTPIIQ